MAYDIAGALQDPNRSLMQGYSLGQNIMKTQQEGKLAGLVSRAFGSQGPERSGYLQQAAALDPTAAMNADAYLRKADNAQQDQEDAAHARIGKAALAMKSAIATNDPNKIESMYQLVRPALAEYGKASGKIPPPNYDPSMQQNIDALASFYGDAQDGQDGIVVGGRLVDRRTGKEMYAPPAYQLKEDRDGNLYRVPVNPGAAPEMVFGGQQTSAQVPSNTFLKDANGQQVQFAGDVPQEVRQALLRDPSASSLDLGRMGGQAPKFGKADVPKDSTFDKNKQFADQLVSAGMLKAGTPEYNQVVMTGKAGNQDGVVDAPGNAKVNGAQYLSSLDPQTAAQVKALAEGRMQFPTGTALKSQYWQQMLAGVAQYDPSFDAVNYNARVNTRKAFTSGKEAQQVNALNTVSEHLGQFSDDIQSLNNSNFPMWNKVANYALSQTGDPRIAKANTDRKAVADEVAKVWRATGGSEADIQENLKNLDLAQSPAQLHAAVGALVSLIKGKVDALQEQYDSGMGTTQSPRPLISPKASDAYNKVLKRAGKSPEMSATAKPSSGGVLRYDPATGEFH